jgi:4-amino-4-deoxy-L-arabinose transferase-like glycosyltransferase
LTILIRIRDVFLMQDAGSKYEKWLGFAVFVYGVLASSAFAFLIYRNQSLLDPTVDLNGFGDIARNIKDGNGFSTSLGPTIRRGPFYPMIGAVLLWLFGEDGPNIPEAVLYRPIIVANCVIFGLSCAVVYWTAKKIFGDLRVALVAAVICPLIPQSLRYVGMTEVETLMALLIILLAATSLTFVERPNKTTGATFGVIVALATLTKPIALLYPFLFLPVAFWYADAKTDRKTRVFASATALVCLGALLLPWSLRNAYITGGEFFGISSNAPGEFLRGYINAQPKYYLLRQDFGGTDPHTEKWDPEANAYEERLLGAHGVPFYRTVRNEAGKLLLSPSPPPGITPVMIEVEKDRLEKAEMSRKLFAEPFDFLKKFSIQLFTFWYIVETRTKSIFVGLIALAVLSLSVAGCVRALRRNALVWPVVMVLIYFNVIYAAFLAFARYSMPLYPTLAVLAAGGIAEFFEWIRPLFSRRARAVQRP